MEAAPAPAPCVRQYLGRSPCAGPQGPRADLRQGCRIGRRPSVRNGAATLNAMGVPQGTPAGAFVSLAALKTPVSKAIC
eukprot:11215313-Lingulodinium_polyedra.AAC.1